MDGSPVTGKVYQCRSPFQNRRACAVLYLCDAAALIYYAWYTPAARGCSERSRDVQEPGLRECPRCSFLNPDGAEHCIKCRFSMSRIYREQPVSLIDQNPAGDTAVSVPEGPVPETGEPSVPGSELDNGPGFSGGLEEQDARNRAVELEDRSYYEIGGYRIGGVPGGDGYSGPPPSDVFAVRDSEPASDRKSRKRGRKKPVKGQPAQPKHRAAKASKGASGTSRPLKVKNPLAPAETGTAAPPRGASQSSATAPPAASKPPASAPVEKRASALPAPSNAEERTPKAAAPVPAGKPASADPPPAQKAKPPRPALDLKANKAPRARRASPAGTPGAAAPPGQPPERKAAPPKPAAGAPETTGSSSTRATGPVAAIPEPPAAPEAKPEQERPAASTPVAQAPVVPVPAAPLPARTPVKASSPPPRKKNKPARKNQKSSSRRTADGLTQQQFPQVIPGSGTPLGTSEEPHGE